LRTKNCLHFLLYRVLQTPTTFFKRNVLIFKIEIEIRFRFWAGMQNWGEQFLVISPPMHHFPENNSQFLEIWKAWKAAGSIKFKSRIFFSIFLLAPLSREKAFFSSVTKIFVKATSNFRLFYSWKLEFLDLPAIATAIFFSFFL